ncbi:2-nitropropane dioxygenase [Verrucomicrobia bacterium LW23]|nr:2-nitropropane dioxygenase [Verrucomicrobia bacterium LW23]
MRGGTPDSELLSPAALSAALRSVRKPLFAVRTDGKTLGFTTEGAAIAFAPGGNIAADLEVTAEDGSPALPPLPLHGLAMPVAPELLGDAGFREAYGLRYAYVAGEMANGIASAEIVEAMGNAGMIGFFGAAGLSLERVEAAIDRIQRNLGAPGSPHAKPYGFNLIHSPSEPDLEAAVADLYLRRGVTRVCASAYLDLTLPVVKYRLAGIHRAEDGTVVTPNKLIAKISRVEVARHFLAPAPERFVSTLVASGFLTAEQAQLAALVPVAEDLTAEADSGGHTDNRPAVSLIPTIIALRDEMQARHRYAVAPRVGAAGGISTPASAAAAFAMGAAYIVTGSVNQACVEAGISAPVKQMLAEAGQADIVMAPAADMFEMGVKVQVLKRGTMFAVRGRKLYEIYLQYPSIDAIPAAVRQPLERDMFRCTLEEAWASTKSYFATRDPRQIARAEKDPKHLMALVFRSYLGQTSRWAIAGDSSRKVDYQVWCGPAMGAFNEWTRGSFLEKAEARDVVTVALNILYGTAIQLRAASLQSQGIPVPSEAASFQPLPRAEVQAAIDADAVQDDLDNSESLDCEALAALDKTFPELAAAASVAP